MRLRISATAVFLSVACLIAPGTQAATALTHQSSANKAFNPASISNRTVYFTSSSAVLGPQSRGKLYRLLPTLKKQTRITLVGYVQTGVTNRNNRSLSLARAKEVRTYLVRHGVTATIVLSPNHIPAKNPKSATARRVEISWGSTDSGGQNAAKGVIWSQEFNGTAGSAIDGNVWRYDLGDNGGWGNSEFEYYTDSTTNSALDGSGNLAIQATPVSDADPLRGNCNPGDVFVGCPSFYSARIKTEDKVGFLYGHIEARMWLPEGSGTWPAFWLLGNDIGSLGWPDCGELDIMEQNNDKSSVHGTVHSNGPDIYMGMSGSSFAPVGDSYAGEWHTFAVNWLPDSIQWLVDGQVYYELTKNDVVGAGYEWVFDHENFVIFNLAMGGNYVQGVNPTDPATMKIDYLRVSTYKGYGRVIKH